jgi:outer membrane protein insertion porin family
MKTLFFTLIVLICFNSQAWSQSDSTRLRNKNGLVVESIDIVGNTKTKDQVIHNLLGFKPGDRITEKHLLNSQQKINSSNFFRKVHIVTQPGQKLGFIRVYVEVEERKWPFFQFKSGYNELDGWYLSPLGIRFDNFWGRGNLLGAEMLIGDRVTGIDMAFLRPSIFQSDLNLRIALQSRNRQFVHYLDNVRYLQYVENAGFSIGLYGNTGLMKYLWFEFVKESFKIDDFILLASDKNQKFTPPSILMPIFEKNNVGRLIISLNVDTRNQVFYPSTGWWGSLSLNQSSPELGGMSKYKKIVLDIRRYQPLYNNWVLAMRLKGAGIDEDAPFYEKFYLGGPNSLRGYADRSLNPLGYASRLVQGSVEFRFPMTNRNFPRQFLTGIFFYDVGQAWNPSAKFDAESLYSSIGFGCRILLPIVGLFRLDFAYPRTNYEFKMHISLGHTF